MKKVSVLFLCAVMLIFSQVNASAISDEFSATKVKIEVASDNEEFSDLIEELVENDNADSFFSEIIIDKTKNTITKDGSEAKELADYAVDYTTSGTSDSMLVAEPLLDTIGLESETDKESGEIIITDPVTEEETVIKGFVPTSTDSSANDENVYISSYQLSEELAIETKDEGEKIIITSPFQTKRILVTTKNRAELKNNLNAEKCISDGEGLYVLQFGTEVEAKEAYASLKKDDSVKNVSIDKIYTASAISDRTGAKTIQSDRYKAYLEKNGKSSQIVVAVIDTGVDSDHPFLKSRLIKNGYNAYGQNTNWEDDHGHGTHVSGIVVDNTPSNVKILPIKVLGADGSGSSLAVKLGIEKAVALGADVINMSLGCVCSHVDCPIEEATNAAIKKGVTVVVAAGNDRSDTKDYCPASTSKCITVASTKNNASTISSFSNYGDAVDVAAPGQNILSCQMGGGYVEMSGTSMASPFAAAAAAMVLTNEPSLTPAQVEKKLTSYTTDMFTAGKDISTGYGVLNFGIALGDKDIGVDDIGIRDSHDIHYFGVNVSFLITPDVIINDTTSVPTNRAFTVEIEDENIFEYNGAFLLPKNVGKSKITFTLPNGASTSSVITVEDSGSWLTVAADSYAGGKGTKDDPYLISTPEQLAKFALDCTFKGNRYSYKLLNDIDLKGRTWISANYVEDTNAFFIGDYREAVFDGNNKKIKNMTLFDKRRSNTLWNSDYTENEMRLYIFNTGFFYNISEAIVKNLGIENGYSSHSDTGLLCFELRQNSQISNCYTSGFSAGNGLFSKVVNYNVKVSNCYSSATVLQNGIAREIYSSLVDTVIFNNVFFCGEQYDSHFSADGTGFSKEITGRKNQATYLHNCFSVGRVVSGAGFAEYSENANVDNCYYLRDNSVGIKNSENMKLKDINAKPLSFFKNKATYTNSSLWNSKYKWDFNKVWAIDGKTNNGFPYLKNNKPDSSISTLTNTWLDYASDSFAGGNGSKKSPYLIETPEQLARIAKIYRYGGAKNVCFKLINDIDLSAHNWYPIGAGGDIDSVFDEKKPILNYEDERISKFRFYGNIDGNGKTISNMKISSKGDFIGFIAISENNEIRNINFKNVSISGNHGCGVVAGYNRLSGKIINCSVTGDIKADTVEPLGGICGKNYRSAQIIGCSALITLCNLNNGIIKNCYNPAGLARESDGVIKNCYTQSEIKSPVIYHSYCEYEANSKKIYKIYDEVYGNINKSLVVSESELSNPESFSGWFDDNSWYIDTANNGKPYISSQKNFPTETLPTEKWKDFADTNFKYGEGTEESPWLISTPEQLAGIKPYIFSHYGDLYCFRLVNDIDLSGKLWDSASAAGYLSVDVVFDGNGKKITGMTTEDGAGLFDLSFSEKSVIKNLSLEDFRGRTSCAIVATNNGLIKNCHIVCGNIATPIYRNILSSRISEDFSGGICETNWGLIENCEANIIAFGTQSVSGIAGYGSGTIKNCSVRGFVLGDVTNALCPSRVDSFFANCYSVLVGGGGTKEYGYTDSYSAADLTGEYIGKNSKYSEDLKKKETFVGWDFETVWDIDPDKNDGYPFIRQPASRKITYVLNGGTNPKYVQNDYIPGNICTPQNPTRKNYTFLGWYTDKELTNKVTKIGSSDNGNVTLYAKWKLNSYSVAFYANGGTGTMNKQTGFEYSKEKALSKCTFTAPKGYSFAGWSTSKDGKVLYTNGQTVKNLTDKNGVTVKLYAVWKPYAYYVSFYANGGTGTMNKQTGFEYGKEKALSNCTFTAPKGYSFAGWSTSKDGKVLYTNGQKVKNLTDKNGATVKLYAKWKRNIYAVTFNANGGTGKMSKLTGFEYGKYKSLTKCTFTPPKGKVFAGWATSKKGKAIYTNRQKVKNLSSKNGVTVTLYAKWVTPKKYTIKYDTNGGKLPEKAKTYYKSGTGYTLPTPTRKGYSFAGWYTDSKLKTGKISIIKPWQTGNITLYAKWTRNTYSIAFNANGGTGKMSKQADFGYNKTKALNKCSFTAPKGKVFAGWATSKNGEAIYTDKQKVKNITAKDGKTVTLYAVWVTPKKYIIKYDTNGGKLPESANKSYKSGTGYTLPKPVRKGYTFIGWHTDSKLKDGKITVIKPWKTGTVKVYAKWKKS